MMGIQEALNKAVEDNRKLEKKLQQKENIIKEVREYIEKNLLKDDNGCGCWWYGFGDYNEAKYELLEILDKENK